MRRFCPYFSPTILGVVLIIALHPPSWTAGPRPRPPAASEQVVACRVMEAHTSPELRVTTVVFHQRDKQEGPRLSNLLVKHSGASVEFQTTDGVWHRATLFRLKSCFGRGLLVFPAAEAQLTDKADFVLRFPLDDQ